MTTLIRVLVVDDEPALCRLIDHILTREGYHVVSVPDGQAAKTVLEKDQDFGLVVTDLLMPKIDGLKILQHIKQYCPTIPVLISSAARDHLVIHNILEQGAAAFLPRPFTPKQLVELVRQILNH